MIYLDNAATTACAEEVVDAMLPFFREAFANAASIDHIPGAAARRAVDEARIAVANMVDARPEDVIFTSGSTEANNLALSVEHRVFTTPIEHPSILDPFAARKRADDARLDVDNEGRVNIESLRERLANPKVKTLVSVIATNNETGVEQDVDALATASHESGALLHIDATQAVLTRSLGLRALGIDGLSLSAHKLYGPKGIGALVASPALRKAIRSFMLGGGHERGFRSGTLNVPGIVGFGAAAKIALSRRLERRAKLRELREAFFHRLKSSMGEAVMETIQAAAVSPHILSLRLRGINGRALLGAIREDLAFSLGSACSTNKAEPSHVLLAMGLDKRAIAETVRISFSAEQTVEEIVRAADIIARACRKLSEYSLSA